jgi:hypothetical protein
VRVFNAALPGAVALPRAMSAQPGGERAGRGNARAQSRGMIAEGAGTCAEARGMIAEARGESAEPRGKTTPRSPSASHGKDWRIFALDRECLKRGSSCFSGGCSCLRACHGLLAIYAPRRIEGSTSRDARRRVARAGRVGPLVRPSPSFADRRPPSWFPTTRTEGRDR